MNRYTLTIVFLFLGSSLFAQLKDRNFGTVDRYALKVKSSTIPDLAKQLTDRYPDELDKVRSVFRWITENISYRMPEKRKYYFETDAGDDTAALKPPEERVAERVLKSRLAYCDGYAKLFKTLCGYAGVTAVTISGYGRANVYHPGPFRTNHTWNAVKIDSNWYLLDLTWATGFVSLANGDFIKRLDESYFLTPPDVFIKDHYPDDLSWSLLSDPPPVKEFDQSPFFARAIFKYPLQGFYPAKGRIRAEIGDTLHFQVETSIVSTDRKIASDFFYDSLQGPVAPSSVFLTPVSIKGNILEYEFVVATAGDKWLHIIYNNDLLMRYRVIIKENENAVVKN